MGLTGSQISKCHYVGETLFGVTPPDAAFKWFGKVTKITPTVNRNTIKTWAYKNEAIKSTVSSLVKGPLKFTLDMTIIPNKKKSSASNYQQLTLALNGYVNCVETDIGKEVTYDDDPLGNLISYDNDHRIWVVDTTTTVLDEGVIKIPEKPIPGEDPIPAGTGSGVEDKNSTVYQISQYNWKWIIAFASGSTSGISDVFVNPYISIYNYLDTLHFLAKGCLPNTFTMRFVKGDTVKFDFGFICKDIEHKAEEGKGIPPGTPTYATEPDTESLSFADVSSLSVNGIPNYEVNSLEVSIPRFLEGDVTLQGGDLIQYLVSSKSDITGRLNMNFTTQVEWIALVTDNYTPGTIVLVIDGITLIIGNIKWDTESVPQTPGSLIARDVPFTAKSFTIIE